MSRLFICLVVMLWAANLPAATNNLAVTVGTNNAAERELQKLMEQDDEAQADADRWIRDNLEFATKGAGAPSGPLNERIRRRFEPVRRGYENFLLQYTNHVRARLAYAGFLGDINDVTNQLAHLEIARTLEPNNPVMWNNLANCHARNGSATNVFICYGKAIAFRPNEPLYRHNLANAIMLFRAEATNYFKLIEQQVFQKALELYQRALQLDPENFPLATDLARTFYDIQPRRTDNALSAWTNALNLAHDNLEREGVYVHLARMKFLAGRVTEARAHLNAITNENYAGLKKELNALLDAKGTEAIPSSASPQKTESK